MTITTLDTLPVAWHMFTNSNCVALSESESESGSESESESGSEG